ncbi:MAG TPA: FmdB family transcriptional regulator [Deltaproteobacteria bacterium]|nr:FmdB family transcriptional regulator [Deltaproteobacteria bacterium]
MPIYEYECSTCGKVFEAFQKITEDPLETCPVCDSPVNRLISQCSFQLKGSGWYVTDYKHGGATSSGNGVKSAESKAEEPKQEKTEVNAGIKAEPTSGTRVEATGGAA